MHRCVHEVCRPFTSSSSIRCPTKEGCFTQEVAAEGAEGTTAAEKAACQRGEATTAKRRAEGNTRRIAVPKNRGDRAGSSISRANSIHGGERNASTSTFLTEKSEGRGLHDHKEEV